MNKSGDAEGVPSENLLSSVPSLLSVVVTAYKRYDYLKDAIDSVKDQTLDRSKYEIIVVRDPEGRKVDGFLADCGVRIIEDGTPNAGARVVTGIRAARGEIVAFLDDDDMLHPNKLDAVSQLFRANPALVYLHNSFDVVNEQGVASPVAPDDLSPFIDGNSPILSLSSMPVRTVRRLRLGFNFSSVSVRRSWVLSFLNPLSSIRMVGDGFLIFVALLPGTYACATPTKLTKYRYHDSSTHYHTFEEGLAAKALERDTIYIQDMETIKKVVDGTPLERWAALDIDYWRFHRAVFDTQTQTFKQPSVGDLCRYIAQATFVREPRAISAALAAFGARINPRLVQMEMVRRSRQRLV